MERQQIIEKLKSFNYQKRWINRFLNEVEKQTDLDKIDFNSYSGDIEITDWLKNEYNLSITNVVEQVNLAKAQIEQDKLEQQKFIEVEEQRIIEEFKKEKAKPINLKSFEIPKNFIKMVAKGFSNSCILLGEGGYGKTWLTINTLKECNIDFEVLNGYITPLSLYAYLFKNKNKLVVIDDTRGIFENLNSVSILKSALWEIGNKRIVNYQTTSRNAENLPSFFEFTGRIIIIGNKMNLKDENINALLSRSLFYTFDFTFDEKIEIMKEIADTPYKRTTKEQRKEVCDFIVANSNPTTKAFNFRTLIKSYAFYLYSKDKWKELVKSILIDDESKALVWKLMHENIDGKSAVRIFEEKTGYCRRTYFRLKKELEI